MKSHSIPSLLGIAAVLIAALVVAIAFGVATDSPVAQAQTLMDYDMDGDGLIRHHRPRISSPPSRWDPSRQRQPYPEVGTRLSTMHAFLRNAAFGYGLRSTTPPTRPTAQGYELMADLDLAKDYVAPDVWTPIAQLQCDIQREWQNHIRPDDRRPLRSGNLDCSRQIAGGGDSHECGRRWRRHHRYGYG